MAIVDLVGSANWARYKSLMRDAQETFAKKAIVWKRSLGGLDRFMEDNNTERFSSINLEVLLQYNAPRTWPIDQNFDFGKQDKESIAILINKEYLNELGYINADGNFDFNPAADRFVFDGVSHRCQGNTDLSQTQVEGIWIMVIVIKDPEKTGD